MIVVFFVSVVCDDPFLYLFAIWIMYFSVLFLIPTTWDIDFISSLFLPFEFYCCQYYYFLWYYFLFSSFTSY